MTRGANRNTLWAHVLAAELATCGIEHVALSPGHRSAPLALALHEQPGIKLSVHVDERSGAYFALGRARATGRPVVTLTTSGTAVANQLPAVVEAHHSCLPLLVLSADRPPRLRAIGANQTIDQSRMFSGYTNWSFELPLPEATEPALAALRAAAGRAVARALGPPAGPVHLNVPFDDPLDPVVVPGDVPESLLGARAAQPGSAPWLQGRGGERVLDPATARAVAKRIVNGRGLIIAGPRHKQDGFPAAVTRLAARLGAPVLADPLSQVRYALHGDALVVGTQDAFLAVPEVATRVSPDWVLQFGATPTSKHLLGLLASSSATRFLIDETGRHLDAAQGPATSLVSDAAGAALQLEAAVGELAPSADTEWLEFLSRLDQSAKAAIHATGEWEATVPQRVLASLTAGDLLFVGSSLPVRDLDRYAPTGPEGVRVHANRGASGIDGTVSSAIGAASAIGGRSVTIIGDLAFQHDMGGLAALRRHAPGLTVVVVNNGGGSIFRGLPVAEHEPSFTELFLTPHDLDIASAARAHGLPHETVAAERSLGAGLEDAAGGVLEVLVDPAISMQGRRDLMGRLGRAFSAL